MLSLKKKYKQRLRMREKAWIEHAEGFFTYEPFSEVEKGIFICGLYKDTETWTGFYEDLVRYQFLGEVGDIEYSVLAEIFHSHLVETRKVGLDDRVEGAGHVIWTVNKFTYGNMLSFVNFMTNVLAAIEKYGEGFSWYKDEDD